MGSFFLYTVVSDALNVFICSIIQRTIRAAVEQHLLDLQTSIDKELGSYESQVLDSQPFQGWVWQYTQHIRPWIWCLFACSWNLNINIWCKCESVCILLYINSPTQKTAGPEDHEDVQSKSEAETETLPEVTEEGLLSQNSEVSN